jgi:hypothetical protein
VDVKEIGITFKRTLKKLGYIQVEVEEMGITFKWTLKKWG